MAAETKTKDELIAEAWDRWRTQDFTWQGLTKKKWRGWVVCADGLVREADSGTVYGQPAPELATPEAGREATLQDYWRTDPETGRWRNDADLLATGELHLAGNAPHNYLQASDGRAGVSAQLLRLVNHHETYHSAHLPLAYLDGTLTGKADWCENALDAHARARLIAAGIPVSDEDRGSTGPDRRAQFDGVIWPSFDVARLSPLPKLSDKTDLIEDTRPMIRPFISARFEYAIFVGFASFGKAAFHGKASFLRAQFFRSAWFFRAQFYDWAVFNSTEFQSDARFDETEFRSFAVFVCAEFRSVAEFYGAKFHDMVRMFSAQFYKLAQFNSAQFYDNASFGSARFVNDVYFEKSCFNSTNFGTAQFLKNAYFDEVIFNGKVDFTAATFNQVASFEEITWPKSADNWHAAFNQAVFRGTLNIAKSGFQCFAAFDGAILERGVQIDEANESLAKLRFLAERDAAVAASIAERDYIEMVQAERTAGDKYQLAAAVTPLEIEAHVKDARERRLRQLERGCRVLKQAMEKASNKTSEQMLYRFELQARRAQSGLPFLEWLFSHLYDWTSEYGASMLRPPIWLALMVVVFGFSYAWMGNPPEAITVYARLESAMTFSASRVFPFGAFDGVSTAWIKDFTIHNGSLATFGLRLLATLESLLAIVLAFLFGLAVRRRFQIS